MIDNKTELSQTQNEKIIKRIDLLISLSIFIDELKGDTIDDKSYYRMKAGLDFLIYEFSHLIDFGLDRQLSIDDLSAKDIAEKTKIKIIEGKDIIIKKGIDIEIEYICNFVDYLIATPAEGIVAEEMISFVNNQSEVNKKIEKLYNKE